MSEQEKQGEVEARVREAYKHLPEIERVRKKLRYVTWAQVLVPMVIVVVGLWSLWATARTNLVDNREELVTQIQDRWGTVWPRLEREANAAAERVMPHLEQELSKAQDQIATKLPEVLAREAKTLNATAERDMKKRLNEALTRVRKAQAKRLEETFGDYLKCTPEDTKDICEEKREALDNLLVQLQETYEQWAIQEMTHTFDRHLSALMNIRQTMTKFARPPGGVTDGDVSARSAASGAAPGDMLMLFLELVADSLGASNDMFDQPGVTDVPAQEDEEGSK